jgi:D-inositol-3-phosphate glycosyltransferase
VNSSNVASADPLRPRGDRHAADPSSDNRSAPPTIVLLTGGKDAHYVHGLTRALIARGVRVELVGGQEELLDVEPGQRGGVRLHDFVGKQDARANVLVKLARVCSYFARLLMFSATTDIGLFHILWFRRFPRFERIALIAILKLLGKTLVFTAHNVDDRARDGATSNLVDRLSLRFLYRTVDHVFVHTAAMKTELTRAFDVDDSRVTVVPLGINDVVPVARLKRAEARRQLGLTFDARTLLFFGNIAPYKGVEDLVHALAQLVREDGRYTVLIAGAVKNPGAETYWRSVERLVVDLGLAKHVVRHVRYIPDEEVGAFFRAADVSVLPYRRVYQSGVLGLSYAQGLPVIAADVGAIREDVVEGETGLLFTPGDPGDLAAKIRSFYTGSMSRDRDARACMITAHGATRFSWPRNAELTTSVYAPLLRGRVALGA